MLDNEQLVPFINQLPVMESNVLSKHIVPDDEKSPLLRDFLLSRVEIMLTKNLPKTTLESMLQLEHKERGGKTLIPTTIKQFKKLITFVSGEVQFYAICCIPCTASVRQCPVCKEDIYVSATSKRPKQLMFVRSVKAYIAEMLRVPALKQAIELYRRREHRPGVISDIWDGRVVRELIDSGMHSCFR